MKLWTYTLCAGALRPLKASAVNVECLRPAETKITTVSFKNKSVVSAGLSLREKIHIPFPYLFCNLFFFPVFGGRFLAVGAQN